MGFGPFRGQNDHFVPIEWRGKDPSPLSSNGTPLTPGLTSRARTPRSTFVRRGVALKKLATGRPPRIDYEPGSSCQLKVEITSELKRGLVQSAERNERRISDEVALALDSWLGCEQQLENI
jgi:hypothetical protein